MKPDIAVAKLLKLVDYILGENLVVTTGGSGTVTETNSAAILSELSTVDGSINNIKSTPTIMATHWSPIDFTAVYTSANTITLIGHEALIDSSQIRGIKVVRADNTSDILVNGAGITMTYSANVITVTGLSTNFNTTDVFEVGINYQNKGYDAGQNFSLFQEQSPLYNRYTAKETIVTAQNLTASYADFGSETDKRGFTRIHLEIISDVNDSEDVEFQILGSFTSGGTFSEIDGLTSETLWSGALGTDFTRIYEFDAGGIPYIKVQAKAGTVGTIPGDLTINLIKIWRA